MPPKFGYPGLAAGFTLALSSLSAAVIHLHEKRQPCRESSKELHKRGKINKSEISRPCE